jgi:predicted TIM-barrel fold metal-dependent hydrolase
MLATPGGRRQFLRLCGATAVGALGPFSRAADAAPPARGRFVDCHVHIGTIGLGHTEPLTVDGLLRQMDLAEIAQAWVLPLVSPEAFPNPVPTEYVLEQTRAHRDRLIPFCVIDPRNTWWAKPPLLPQVLQRYVDAGARGFGEHKAGVAIDDPRNLELYAACDALRLPVLFHLDALCNVDEPGLPGLDRVLGMFPELPFIGHAHGFWASISGDVTTREQLGRYGRGPVAPGGALERLLAKHPRLYADISSGSGSSALRRDPEFTRGFVERWQDRLLFGTDYLSPGWDTGQHALLAELRLPPAVEEKIRRGNASALIRAA